MKVFVTGATSLVGGAVVAQLVDRGDQVSVFQRRPSGLDVAEHLGDITDRETLARAMEGAEAVLHFAARVAVTGPWEQFEKINIGGTRNAIEAAHSAGVSRFVYVSSPSVAHAGHPIIGASADPADPDHARGHYATSKAQAELLALGASSGTMPVVAIRPHLIWGPGDAQLVGRIVDRARKGRLAIVGSGAALIDSIYIDNAADALVAAVDRVPVLGGRALVVTNGQPRPVGELVGRIVGAAGLTPPRRKIPFRVAKTGGLIAERLWALRGADSEPPMTSFLAEQLATAHWFDQTETRKALRWEPKVSLDEGFKRLAQWFADGASRT